MKRMVAGLIVLAGLLLTGLAGADGTPPSAAELAAKAAQQTSTGSGGSDFLYELRNSGAGGLYGELLSLAQERANEGLNEALQVGQEATVLAGRIKSLRDRIAKVNQAVGRLLVVMDVANKLAAGDTEAAAWSVGFAVLGELAGKEAVYKAMGFTSSAPITAALVAAQVFKASRDALARETQSRAMQSFYGTVERVARVRGRELGEKPGPFPATPENIEKIWQLILKNLAFRDSFGSYVQQDLQGEWPQAGFFERLDASCLGLTTSSDELQQAQRQELEALRPDIDRHIASLLAGLNRVALLEERRVLAVNALRTLQQYFARYGVSLEQGLKNMEAAGRRLPEAADFANACQAKVRQAIEEQSLDSLSALRAMIIMYVRDVLRWLPPKGTDATLDRIFARLASAYDLINAEMPRLRQKIEDAVASPQPTFAPETDAASLYRSHFKDMLKPFDWGGQGGGAVAIDKMAAMLAAGQFRASFDKEALPEGRVDYAGSILRAWQRENYAIACGGGSDKSIEAPAEEETLQGYYRALSDQIEAVYAAGTGGVNVDEGWVSAHQMALSTLDNLKQLTRLEYEETTRALSDMRSVYLELARKAYVRAREIDDLFAVFGGQAFSPAFSGYARSAEGLTTTTLPEGAGDDPVGLDGLIVSLQADFGAFQLSAVPSLNGADIGMALNDYVGRRTHRIQREIERIQQFSAYVRQARELCYAVEDVARCWDRIVAEAQSDLWDIRRFVDPDFMQSELFSSWTARRGKAPVWVAAYRAKAAQLAADMERYGEERIGAMRYLRVVERNLREWLESGRSQGILTEKGTHDSVATLTTGYRVGSAEPFGRSQPYPHYVTGQERDRLSAEMQSRWAQLGLARFCRSYAPWLQEVAERYFQELGQVTVAEVDNFLACVSGEGCSLKAVTDRNLTEAENALRAMVPGTDSFMESYGALNHLLPLAIAYPGQPPRETFKAISAASLKAPLAARYIGLRDTLKKKLGQHYTLMDQQKAEQAQRQAQLARQRLPELLATLQKRIERGNEQARQAASFSGRGAALDALIATLQTLRQGLTADPYRTAIDLRNALMAADGDSELASGASQVFNRIGALSTRLAQALARLEARRADVGADIRAFYEAFQEAYRQKDRFVLLSLLSDDWEAGDGTTLMDVEEYFDNMFTVFDQIDTCLTNLSVQQIEGSRYRASYDLQITGRIYADNLKHVERSSVQEELLMDEQGRVRIVRTPQGRFWYVQ